MNRGVIYLIDGTKLAARLVVSLYSLRQHYSGPITVLSSDSSASEVCTRIASDPRLAISHVPIVSAPSLSKNRGYLLKTVVHRYSPFDTSVFLDCDTLVRRPIDELFVLPSSEHILVTQFSNWCTSRGIIRHRICSWSDLCPELIQPALAYGKAVNSGVFSFTPQTRVFDRWHSTALAGRERFIPDEIALQLLLPHYPCEMVDERFNCSAKFGRPTDPETRIVHFHGRRHVGSYGSLWKTAYDEVISRNMAGIRSWTPATDRQLREHLQTMNGVPR